MAPAEQPTFYYDLGSPYAWLAAERIHALLPVVPVWQPILLGGRHRARRRPTKQAATIASHRRQLAGACTIASSFLVTRS